MLQLRASVERQHQCSLHTEHLRDQPDALTPPTHPHVRRCQNVQYVLLRLLLSLPNPYVTVC
ncbi:hypothetical protein KQR71_003046 [Acinetobacter baumannii]